MARQRRATREINHDKKEKLLAFIRILKDADFPLD